MMELRQKEIVKRVLRDGECFIRYFELNGMVYIRFINPEEIKDIKFSSDDAEMPEYYHREWVPKGQQEIVKKDIPANEILHIKPPWIDLDMARGRPYLEPVIKRLTQFDQFVNNRVIRNKIMAAIVLEKILHGSGATASKVSSITSGMSDVSKDADVTKASKKMPKAGSVIIHNDNIEYKWNTADVKASDCKEDARLIKTSIVTGVNAPEFILGDASNANYASTLVSENPYVRAMEDLQDTFEAYFKMIFKRVIEKAILANKLSRMSNETIVKENLIGMFMPDSDIKIIKKVKELIGQTSSKKPVETKTNVEIEFPPMVHRDLKMDTEALQIHSTMGWASDQTIAAKLGYDYEKEQKEIEQWKKEHPDEDMEYEKDRDAEIKKEKNGDTEEN